MTLAYHAELEPHPNGYSAFVVEIQLTTLGTTKAAAMSNAAALIEEACGDKDPFIVWL